MLKCRDMQVKRLMWGALWACGTLGPVAHAQPTPGDETPLTEQDGRNPRQDQPQHEPAGSPTQPTPAGTPDEKPVGKRVPDPAANIPARLLFRQAVTALGKVRSISFHISSGGTGTIASHSTKVEADVKMVRAPRAVVPGWHVHAKGSAIGAEGELTEFDAAWLDATVEWQDVSAKLVMERPKAEATKGHKEVSRGNLARFEEFVSTQPFKRELAATDYTIEDRARIGGVECEVVLVKVNSGNLPIRWWLGVEDHLPRRSETIFTGSLAGSRVSEVTNLIASPDNNAIPPEDMRVPVPEGFREDRAMPAATPPHPNTTRGIAAAETKPGTDANASAPAQVAPQARLAPEFELTDVAGAKVTLVSLRGKVAVAEFAGSWALDIADARQEFQSLLDRYKAEPVLGLSFAVRERSREGAVEEYRKKPYTFDLLPDADAAAKAFGVSGYPSYALIGPEGELLMAPTPFQPADTMVGLADAIDAALSKMKGTPAPPKAAKAKVEPKAGDKVGPKAGPTPAVSPTTPAAPVSKPATNFGPKLRPLPKDRQAPAPAKPDTRQ